MNTLLGIILALSGLTICTSMHYSVIHWLDAWLHRSRTLSRHHVPMAVACVTIAHIVEIAVYAGLFWLASEVLHLGGFNANGLHGAGEYFALAAESYTSFGYGDIIPTGMFRIIVSISPINGLMLLAWSGAFLYAAVHQRR